MSEAVNPYAAWWAQSYGFPATMAGAKAAFRQHGTWTFQAFITRCVRQAERLGFRPSADRPRYARIVLAEAIADTLRRFPA